MSELKSRIQRTLDFIESGPAASVENTEQREVQVPARGTDPLQFKGEDYLRFFVLPNFFFHVTTAYAILRHNGVDLGKGDYLGRA